MKTDAHPNTTQSVASITPQTIRVRSIDQFIAHTEVADCAQIGAVVTFANNELGLVWQVSTKTMVVILLSFPTKVVVGMSCKLAGSSLYVRPDDSLLGRIVDPMLQSRDGKPLSTKGNPLPVFGAAPSFHERSIVDSQLATGVLMVDTLLPIVKGQRISVIGDNKTGKTTFLTQVAAAQAQNNPEAVMVYVIIGKRRHDLTTLIEKLRASGAEKKTVIVVADMFDSLPMCFLAPYVGCAIAESFWRSGRDTVVFYDDLSTHAKIYREMSLLLGLPPGREGYPGDMFWQHSSLLERAGKLSRNKAAQTVLAVGTTPTGDLTGYLPTSMISMTDGQIIFNQETMHEGHRPAIDIGISVSRVGGRTQTPQLQKLATRLRARLASYRVAKNLARFGSTLSDTTNKEIAFGDKLYEMFHQSPAESYSLRQQYIMLEALLQSEDPTSISVAWLKSVIADVTAQDIDEKDYVSIAKELLKANPMVKQP